MMEITEKDFPVVNFPDREEMSALVISAKGDRTLDEFSEATGLSPSMLSRIINMKYNKNLSFDVIKAIADQSKDEFVSLFELASANGMECTNRISYNSKREQHLSSIIGQILYSELITRISSLSLASQPLKRLEYTIDPLNSLSVVSNSGDLFRINVYSSASIATVSTKKSDATRRMTPFAHFFNRVFLEQFIYSDDYKNVITIIALFSDEELNYFLKFFANNGFVSQTEIWIIDLGSKSVTKKVELGANPEQRRLIDFR